MSLQKYVQQLNPIQENKVSPVVKIDTFLQEQSTEAEKVIASVGSGSVGEAVYESWVYIVAKLSGKNTLPTMSNIKSISSESEFVKDGAKWINNYRKKFGTEKSDDFLCEAIEIIGGDIKKIPNVNWGSVDIIHNSINTFYKNVPEKYFTKGSKANTADMILVTSGSAKDLLNKLSTSSMNWTKEGVISVEGTNIKFIQVSLKKGMDNARIGKLNTLINTIYGKQSSMPSQLVGEDLSEGILSNVFGRFTDILSKGFNFVLKFAKSVFSKIRNSILKSAIKITKLVVKDKMHKSSEKLTSLLGSTLSEGKNDPVKINAPMLREMKVLKNELIAKDLVNKEYDLLLENVQKLNNKKPNIIKLSNSGTNPKLEMKQFINPANIVLSRGLNAFITRDELLPALKLVANYASYKTFNAMLSDMLTKVDVSEKVTQPLVALSAKLKSEAMFGDTLLPLWIVYGTGGGAYYKHTKNEFEDMTAEKINELGESMNVPFMVLKIGRSLGKKDYNSINLYLLVGAVKVDTELKPEYLVIQFINRSGSTWSYKIDASTKVLGEPK